MPAWRAYHYWPRFSHLVRDWHARRSAREAFALIERERWPEASAKARDAYQLSATEPETWRAIARLLSRTGQGEAALEWWAKLAQAGRLSLDDRREYAAAALAAGDLSNAAAQIDVLLRRIPSLPEPGDALLAAQLYTRRMDGAPALAYAERALNDPRATSRETLAAGILLVGMTAPDSPPNVLAWGRIEELGRETENPLSLDALVFLAQQRPAIPASLDEISFSNLASSKAGRAGPSLQDMAVALENHPRAQVRHKLLALELRARDKPWNAEEYVRDAIRLFRDGDDDLKELVAWLNGRGRSKEVLEVLPLEKAREQRDLSLQYVEALGAEQRWTEVKEILSAERLPLDPMVQHMYLAGARAKLGEATGETNEWQRALENANTPEKLLSLGNYAERHEAPEVAETAYTRATSLAPKMRAAQAARLQFARTQGRTAEARTIAAEMMRIWPDDAAVRQEETYLRILLGASREEVERAEEEMEPFVGPQSTDWNARKTLAVARLRLGKTAAALQAFSGVRATGSEPDGALAVRAAALAANGWKEGAQNDARNLAAANLLPEERALLLPIIGDADR